MAIVALLSNLPIWMIQFRGLRYDVVRLVVRTPEFWYFATNSALWCCFLAVYLNGLRSISALVFFMMSMAIAFVDADAMFTNRLMFVALLGVVVNLAVMALVNRRVIDGVTTFAIVSSGSTSLQVEDVIVSGLVSNTLMLIRNAYRRRSELADQRRMNCLLLRCIVYRRRAKLQLVDESTTAAGHSGSCVINATVVRMVSSPVLTRFPARNIAFPMDLTDHPWRKRTRVAIASTAWVSIALTVIAFVIPPQFEDHDLRRHHIAIMGLILTLASCALFWSLCQRQLLRYIVQSFDFLYLSVQLTLAHVCTCEFLDWDERSFAVICSWLWMHVVLTSDAITPVVRAKTGLWERYLAPVLAVFITGLVALAVHLVFIDSNDTGSRVLFKFTLGERKFEIRFIRVFLARFVSILWWSLRVLARVWTAREGDMVELHMRVGYATNPPAGYHHDAQMGQSIDQGEGDATSELRGPAATNQVAPMCIATFGPTK